MNAERQEERGCNCEIMDIRERRRWKEAPTMSREKRQKERRGKETSRNKRRENANRENGKGRQRRRGKIQLGFVTGVQS